jgi:hypothetical protein
MRIKIFLASSSELEQDRREFEIQINRKNKLWNNRGVFLDLQMWEDFLDAVSRTRSQDEYNRAIKECDIFIMLAGTKIGKYTAEEFETAFAQFKATNKPLIYTYIKDVEISSVHANKDDLKTLWAFQEKLETLEHFWTPYPNADRLKNHFIQQLDKLAEDGRIDLIDEPQMSRGSFGQVTTTGGRLAVNHPGPHVKRDACVNQIKWLEHEIRARPNWLIIEGPTDAGKSVLATQVLDGLSLPSKTVTPSAVFDSGTLGGDFCLLIDPIESGSGLGMDQGNVHLSPLEALLYQIAQKHPQRPVIFCTRESAVADFIEQFALRTRSLERYSERIQCKRDFIDSFTPDEQRRFLDILGIPDRTVHESLLRVVPRLPSSPGMMRVLAQLTVSSLRQILDLADTDPDADLTQKSSRIGSRRLLGTRSRGGFLHRSGLSSAFRSISKLSEVRMIGSQTLMIACSRIFLKSRSAAGISNQVTTASMSALFASLVWRLLTLNCRVYVDTRIALRCGSSTSNAW